MIALQKGGLIVSCQARADNPLHGPVHMAAMARAAEAGGAVAIRANGTADVTAIRNATNLPVIGINKLFRDGEEVYITPDIAAADAIIATGAEVIGLDCTDRPRAGDDWQLVLRHISNAGRLTFADISNFEEGVRAADAGADFVATTLAGHTTQTRSDFPVANLGLIEQLAARLAVPVIAEGMINTPQLARAALLAGAHAVVVGTMITNPCAITRAFVADMTGLA